MIQPMSVEKCTRSPGPMSDWYAASRAIETRKPPWTWSTPFGRPVVPEVYASRYGASESTCTGSTAPVRPATSSSQKTSRPADIGASEPSRRHTTTRSTDGAVRSASSAISFIATTWPRRSEPSAVISAVAPASASRAAIAWAAKPEKIGTCTAPRCASACEAIATSGAIGRNVPTTSPSPIPSAARPSASRYTSRESSAHESARRPPSSGCQTAASPSSPAQRWTQFHARLSLPPTNQRAHSGPRDSSSTASHGCENSSPRSSTTAGQNRSGSSTETRWSAWKSAQPRRRISRVTFACSTTSALGSQT